MYEYQTTTHHGTTPPTTMLAPPGYRLRDIKFQETSRSGINSGTECVAGCWVMIWERYVPEQGEQ